MKVKTMRGQSLDMSQLIAKNEKTVALGNGSMNARGDIVDARGQVITPRERATNDYYNRNPKSVKQVALRDISSEVFVSPAEALASIEAAKAAPPVQTAKTTKEAPKAKTEAPKRKIEDND